MIGKDRLSYWESLQNQNDLTYIYGLEKRRILEKNNELPIEEQIIEKAAAAFERAIYKALKWKARVLETNTRDKTKERINFMPTVPNQNIMVIHRNYPEANFLQISNKHWQDMIKETKDPYALVLYLYFVGNANLFHLEVSPVAIQNATGLARSTYYKKLALLEEKGYVVHRKGNVYDFYETPHQKTDNGGDLPCEHENLQDEQVNPQNEQESPSQKQNCSPDNIEIYKNNIYNTDKKDNKNKSECMFIF